MIRFNTDYTEMFLGVVRKYMQIRGGFSQKDLAIKVNVGVSTMSRFLNQKTKEIDPQMIASIVSSLQIPLHEVIDYVEEDSTQTFKKLVSFYKEGQNADKEEVAQVAEADSDIDNFEAGLGERRTTHKTTANIRGVKVPFGERPGTDSEKPNTMRDKLSTLSPRQKGFLTDFLDLDMESRDLIVDIGNSLYRYFKQGEAEF